ncbi:putative alkaline shock family protein YloU [Actinomadura rupiterrae]|nr:Asp23/Gls24 family envelope stress response protein [Actinomadura rupiterrae]MCP2334874.1 putative alkaline shock family protein YloU [Actinomadura rupiterrae]
MSQQSGQQATKERPVDSLPSQHVRSGAGHKPNPSGGREVAHTGDGALVSDTGKTRIADGVVAKIAGMAAREVGGVYAMGAGMARTFGSVKERIPGVGVSVTQGVAVQVGEKQAAVDIDLVVEYGVAIPDLARACRESVISQVEQMTGLEVVEVNITVDDVHLPGEENNHKDDASHHDAEKPAPRVK